MTSHSRPEPTYVLAVADGATGAAAKLPAGSGVVAVPWRTITPGMQLVYFEPPHEERADPQTLADRVGVAYKRAWEEHLNPAAPGLPVTYRTMVVWAAAVKPIGQYRPADSTITLLEGAAAVVARWLQLSASEVVNGELARHLASTRSIALQRRPRPPLQPHPAAVAGARGALTRT